MTARADRDLQQVVTADGKSTVVFDKARATEHQTEPNGGFDHSPIISVWVTEFGNHVMCIEAQDGGETHWMQISPSRAHAFFSERGLHHLVSDAEFERLLI